MRVLHYLNNLGLGGTEKTCQLFMKYASNDVALAYKKSGDLTRLGEFKNTFSVNSNNQLMSVIDDFKPDIFHVYRSGYSEYPNPEDIRGNVAFVETNVFGFVDWSPCISKTLFMSKWLKDYSLRNFVLEDEYAFKRFDFVNNPVEKPHTTEILPIAKEWKAEGCIIVGRCGRPDNGIYNSINVDAVKLLRQEGHDIRFIVLAPPSNMVTDLEHYDIPYHAIDPTIDPILLSKFYNSLDVYCHARADGETFGISVAESMVHNLPVITHVAEPSVPGMGVFQAQTELVDHGVTGLIVQNEAQCYAKALRWLINNEKERNEMGMAGKEKALEQYEASKCVQKLETIYKEIVEC